MSSTFHLRVRRAAAWAGAEPDGGAAEGPSVQYDELHDRVVLIRGTEIRYRPAGGGDPEAFKTLRARPFSPRRCRFNAADEYAAVQASDTLIEVWGVASGALVASREVRAKGVRLEGLHWLRHAPAALVAVTSNSLELYQLAVGKKSSKLKHVKSVAHTNRAHHWCLADAAALLLVDTRGVYHLHELGPKSLSRRCKFNLFPPEDGGADDEAAGGARAPEPRHVSLVSLYGKVAVLVVDERQGQLHMLGFSNDAMKRTNVYSLFAPGGRFALSLVDNVVVAHHLDAHVALLFDVRSDPRRPLSAPLSIAPPDLDAAPAGSAGVVPAAPAARDTWEFLSPNYVVDRAAAGGGGVLWRLELRLPEISRSWSGGEHDRLVDFLMRRGTAEAKQLVLDLLRTFVVAGAPLRILSRLFNMLNRVNYDHKVALSNGTAVPPPSPAAVATVGASAAAAAAAPAQAAQAGPGPRLAPVQLTSHGYQLVSQEEVCDHVFHAAHGQVPAARLVEVVTEFVRSVYRFYLATGTELNELLVDLLLEEGMHYELHQHLQYHILTDSVSVARKLVALGEASYPPALQLGMDMMYRLNAFGELLRLMLRKGRVLAALRLLSPRSVLFREAGLGAADFLEAAVRTERREVFYTAFKFFEERNVAVSGSAAFPASEGCERFVDYFRRTFEGGAASVAASASSVSAMGSLSPAMSTP